MTAEFAQRLRPLPAERPTRLDDPAALAEAGLPPRPPGEGPALAAWLEALAETIDLLPVGPEPGGTAPASWTIDTSSGDSRHISSNCNATAGGPSTVMGSNNWSGATLLASRGQRFAWITGGWTATPVAPAAPEECRTSVWLGFDGLFRRSLSLPQCGVTQIIPASDDQQPDPAYTAWFQWWERDTQRIPGQPRIVPPLEFKYFPIAAGDRIRCFLWATEQADAIGMLLVNLSQRRGLRLICNAARDNGQQTPIDGTTASWVVERPSRLDAEDPEARAALWPIAPYGALEFTGCHAVQRAGEAATLRDLAAARLIRMRGLRAAPDPASYILSAPRFRPAWAGADRASLTLDCDAPDAPATVV